MFKWLSPQARAKRQSVPVDWNKKKMYLNQYNVLFLEFHLPLRVNALILIGIHIANAA